MSTRSFVRPDPRWWIVIGTAVTLAALALYLLDSKAGRERRARMVSLLNKPRRAAA